MARFEEDATRKRKERYGELGRVEAQNGTVSSIAKTHGERRGGGETIATHYPIFFTIIIEHGISQLVAGRWPPLHRSSKYQAWVSQCPLLGDKLYDGGGLAKTLRENGFYLCSNRVTLEHPFYNTPQGKREWAAKRESVLGIKGGRDRVSITEEAGVVLVHCAIDLPAKFQDF